MLIRIFPPFVIMDVVYPDNTCFMKRRSFPGESMCLITGFLFIGSRYCFENVWVLSNILILLCFGYQCNKVESVLNTHEPSRGFVQLSLSEIW